MLATTCISSAFRWARLQVVLHAGYEEDFLVSNVKIALGLSACVWERPQFNPPLGSVTAAASHCLRLRFSRGLWGHTLYQRMRT